jgi:hypothetical protein
MRKLEKPRTCIECGKETRYKLYCRSHHYSVKRYGEPRQPYGAGAKGEKHWAYKKLERYEPLNEDMPL